MTNIVKDLFIRQSCLKIDSFEWLTVTLEAVATCLDTLEGLSQHPAPLSPASELQQIQNHNVDAADLMDILPL